MRRHRTKPCDDQGVVAIELVLILPFLLMLLMGVVVLGNYLSVKGQASNWARDGARQAALFPHTIDTTDFPDGVTFSIENPCPPSPPPNARPAVTVRATMNVELRSIPLIPVAFSLPSTLTQEVTMRCGG